MQDKDATLRELGVSITNEESDLNLHPWMVANGKLPAKAESPRAGVELPIFAIGLTGQGKSTTLNAILLGSDAKRKDSEFVVGHGIRSEVCVIEAAAWTGQSLTHLFVVVAEKLVR